MSLFELVPLNIIYLLVQPGYFCLQLVQGFPLSLELQN
jgi:hypothetical protein